MPVPDSMLPDVSTPETDSKRRTGASETVEKVKTRSPALCRYFQMSLCTKGANCRFAHADEDLDNINSSMPPYRGKCIKTKICRFYNNGSCRNGAECLFAHNEDELQGFASTEELAADVNEPPRGYFAVPDQGTAKDKAASRKDLDQVDDWTYLPSWFAESDTDEADCSTSSEVGCIKQDEEEEDNDSTATSLKPDSDSQNLKDWKQFQSDSSEEDNDSFFTAPSRYTSDDAETVHSIADSEEGKVFHDIASDKECAEEEPEDLSALKVHRWDQEAGSWVVEFLDLTDVSLSNEHRHGFEPSLNEVESQCAEPMQCVNQTSAATEEIRTIKLEAILPGVGARTSLKSTIRRFQMPESEMPPQQTRLTSLRKTPLHTSAAPFIPLGTRMAF